MPSFFLPPPVVSPSRMPNAHPRASHSHHVDGGFRNPSAPAREASPVEVAQWLAGQALDGKHNVPPRIYRTPDLTAPTRTTRITWIGHASTLIQFPNASILTDPHFGPRASPISFAGPRRLADVPLKIRDLPDLDLVVLSHDHYDHLDYHSVMTLEEIFSPQFAAPLGCADRLRDWGIQSVHAFDWWEYEDLDLRTSSLRLHCLPAIHFSGRTLFDRNTTLWASWMIESDAARIYFGGDTAYGDHFSAIHDAFGRPDAALLPIGAYTPRAIMQPVHVNPQEAVQAALDLGRPLTIPIHWGTFDLAAETIQAPATEVVYHAERTGLIDRLHLLRLGENVEILD